MATASAPPYPDAVIVQQSAPTRNADLPPTYEDSTNPDLTAAVLLALLNIIPLGMIVLGSLNLHRCHIEPYIPIWLIVTGVFSLLKSATNFFYRARRQRAGQPPSPADVNPNPFDGLLLNLNGRVAVANLKLVHCCTIPRRPRSRKGGMDDGYQYSGSVWIYSVYDEVQYTSPSDIDFCDQFTFVFSFVFVTLGYVLLALTMCCFCCCCCCICCRPKRQQVN
ncbi:unnamed protein product [Toxocara canis]|uniref:Transmembrane protein 272 n=1 Tax=Toxocara canis TaxID=6265 RepID=A0A183UMC4_TOXCA|nr:unnamed protein product [Toxocara canis]